MCLRNGKQHSIIVDELSTVRTRTGEADIERVCEWKDDEKWVLRISTVTARQWRRKSKDKSKEVNEIEMKKLKEWMGEKQHVIVTKQRNCVRRCRHCFGNHVEEDS